MSLRDFRREGSPADVGVFQFPASALVFLHIYSGTTYYVSVRSGERGWVLVACGVVPENVINATFTALGAGAHVVLLDSTFTLVAAGISFTANNQGLDGQGRGSFIDGDALNTGIHAINISAWDDCTVRNLSVQTQDGGGKTCHCIFIEDGADRFVIENVVVVDSDDQGIHVEGTSIDGGQINSCKVLDSDGVGVSIDMDGANYCDNLQFEGCTILSAGGNGCLLTDLRYGEVSKLTITGSAENGLELSLSIECTLNVIVAYSNVQHGIRLSRSSRNTVTSSHCCFNDSGNTANYDGIYIDADCYDNQVIGNMCYGNHRYGIYTAGFRSTISGNSVSVNDREGIWIFAVNTFAIVEGNYVYDNGWDANYNGIYVYSITQILIVGNYCTGTGAAGHQKNGIYLRTNSNNVLIANNYCYNHRESGIALTDDTDNCSVIGNYLMSNTLYGVDVNSASADNNLVKNNYYSGNGLGCIRDLGTNTRLSTEKKQFSQGGNEASGILIANFIHADALAKGWEIDADTEWAIATGQLPREVQQLVRIKVWAVALAAPGAAAKMRLELIANAGQSDEAFNGEAISVVNKPTVEVNFAINDIIHWVFTSADDVDIGDLIGGDNYEVKVKHEAAGNGDIATDAVFRCVEFEYV